MRLSLSIYKSLAGGCNRRAKYVLFVPIFLLLMSLCCVFKKKKTKQMDQPNINQTWISVSLLLLGFSV